MQDDVQLQVADKPRGKAKGKGAAGPKGPELQIARMLVRALWQQEWSAANPDKTAAERTAAWRETRQAVNESELRGMRRALTAIKRAGVTMAIAERAAKGEADEAEAVSAEA